jgi:hypothetical protein
LQRPHLPVLGSRMATISKCDLSKSNLHSWYYDMSQATYASTVKGEFEEKGKASHCKKARDRANHYQPPHAH